MAHQVYAFDRPQGSRSSSAETAIWRPLPDEYVPIATQPRAPPQPSTVQSVHTRFPPRVRAISPPTTPSAQSIPTTQARTISPRAALPTRTEASPPARAISPRVTSPRLQQWRMRSPTPGDGTLVASETRSGRLAAARSPQGDRSAKLSQEGHSQDGAPAERRVASPPARRVSIQPNIDVPEVTGSSQTREGGRSLRRLPEPQNVNSEINRPPQVEIEPQASTLMAMSPTVIQIAQNSELQSADKDTRVRSSIAPAADPRPLDTTTSAVLAANKAAHSITSSTHPPLATQASLDSLAMDQDMAHKWELSHDWAFLDPKASPPDPVRPPRNFSRPLRSAASFPSRPRKSNHEEVGTESPLSTTVGHNTATEYSGGSGETKTSSSGVSAGNTANSVPPVRASTKSLLAQRKREQQSEPPVSKDVVATPAADEITSVNAPSKSKSPGLVRRGTHPPSGATLASPRNSNGSGGSGEGYRTMTALPDFAPAAGRRKWQASTFDTSALSEKKMEKLKKKGINPALYLEMKAARKGKGLSPLVGNTYIG